MIDGVKGFRTLTLAERQERTQHILEMIAEGLSNEDIAQELQLSSHTISEWISSTVMPQLGVPAEIHTSCRRAALIALAYHKGYLKVPQSAS